VKLAQPTRPAITFATSMAKVSTKPPSGMRDFLPIDLARRRHVVDIVRDTYERYGFVPLETPAIENLEILLGKYGEDEKLIYRLLHRGEVLQRALEGGDLGPDTLSDQALRYDLTVPLARVVAQYGELPKFFKRYQIQPVWRADRPGKGRFREFYQCDVDIVGSTSMLAEAEVCGAGCEVLDRLGFPDVTLAVNHRQLLRGLIRTAGIDPSLEGTALVAVDKLDKIGRDGVLAELGTRGIADEAGRRLLDLIVPDESASNDRVLADLRAGIDDADGSKALDQLAELVDLMQATPAGAHVRITPQLARGLSYYTGPIFEMRVHDLGSSIAGGGRYDELVGMFGKQKVPAVGLSLGLERILVVMAERNMYPELAAGAELMLCWMNVARTDVLTIAHRIRAQGIRVEVYPEDAKLGKQIQYADSPGVKTQWVAIVGEAEASKGTVMLKHLGSGDQSEVAIDDVGAAVRGRNA
jgi:histidyl-tRNA synthetase